MAGCGICPFFGPQRQSLCICVCVQSSSAGDLKGFFDSVWLFTVRTWNISFVADVHMCLWVCVYVWVSVECVIIFCASERNARLYLMLINVCQNRWVFDCSAYGPDSYMHLLQAAGWCPESKSFEPSKICRDRRALQLWHEHHNQWLQQGYLW